MENLKNSAQWVRHPVWLAEVTIELLVRAGYTFNRHREAFEQHGHLPVYLRNQKKDSFELGYVMPNLSYVDRPAKRAA